MHLLSERQPRLRALPGHTRYNQQTARIVEHEQRAVSALQCLWWVPLSLQGMQVLSQVLGVQTGPPSFGVPDRSTGGTEGDETCSPRHGVTAMHLAHDRHSRANNRVYAYRLMLKRYLI